jgi:enoyl-CoA hydratase
LTDLVLSERRGPVALLTLNRPDALNALNAALLKSLAARTAEIAADSSIRAVVVTGAGRAFAAGADIAAMREMTPVEGEAFSRLGHRVLASLEELSAPTIAAVNGFALGGGCELACACDWIYATRKARFGQPEVNLGLIPGFGGTSRLPRRVGVGWGRELVMTGEAIPAEVAERIGLVNRVFEDADALLEAAIKAGENVAAKGPLAIARAKRLLHETPDADLRVAHACEQSAFEAIFATEDSREGMSAFLEKRDPQFRGR